MNEPDFEIEYPNKTAVDFEQEYFRELNFIRASGYSGMGRTALAVQVAKAYEVIRQYLCLPKDADLSEYFYAACELAVSYYVTALNTQSKLNGDRSITQRTQGSRSETLSSADISYDSHGLTDTVKAMLPLPFLRIL